MPVLTLEEQVAHQADELLKIHTDVVTLVNRSGGDIDNVWLSYGIGKDPVPTLIKSGWEGQYPRALAVQVCKLHPVKIDAATSETSVSLFGIKGSAEWPVTPIPDTQASVAKKKTLRSLPAGTGQYSLGGALEGLVDEDGNLIAGTSGKEKADKERADLKAELLTEILAAMAAAKEQPAAAKDRPAAAKEQPVISAVKR